MTDPQSAIGFEEADALFAPLRKFAALLLAVSGGPDSLALLQLAAEWRLRHPGAPRLFVATVDHRLRAASAIEAEVVAAWAAGLGLPHATLVWDEEKPSAGLPHAARDARYRLLEAHVRETIADRPAAVVTAHTSDDQAETFLMRLKRGAGVDGLAAMSAERSISPGSDIALVRPFLSVPKARLLTVLDVRSLSWCDDPTNADEDYERVRVRKALQGSLADAGISAAALALSARRMQQARTAIDHAVDLFTATLDLKLHGEIFAELDRDAFERGPALLRQRVLSTLISRFGGATPPPELAEVERAAEELGSETCSLTTLGGAMISRGSRALRLWREEARILDPAVRLEPGTPRVWDQRFRVAIPANETRAVAVRPLGARGLRLIEASGTRTPDCPARAAYALPAFWHHDELLAVPQLRFFLPAPHATSADCATMFTSTPVNAV